MQVVPLSLLLRLLLPARAEAVAALTNRGQLNNSSLREEYTTRVTQGQLTLFPHDKSLPKPGGCIWALRAGVYY